MKKILIAFIFIFLCAGNTFAEIGVIDTIKFKEADIRVVLQAIMQKAVKDNKKVNLIISPDIQGIVTLDLENVDWITALDALLKTYDYGYEWIGQNIILVDTLNNFAEKRRKTADARVAEPMATRVYSFDFAQVKAITDVVTRMLTPQGRLTFDERTNSLVITDLQSNLAMLEETFKTLDAITPQVLIEAKILETDLELTRKLGVDWNISVSASGSKRPTTWPFTQKNNLNKSYTDETNISFPDPTSDLFTFGTLDASNLSATLDIIFKDNGTKILSMPKIATLDNNTASIDVVTEDPIPNYTYNKDTSSWEINGYEWKKYGVTLEVTPQINNKNLVTLTVKPRVSENVDTKTFKSGSAAEATLPVLSVQTTSTKVMIKDGATLVIGGLVREKTTDFINKIPVLGDLPLLGYAFKHQNKGVVKRNLLIFITPKIVTPDQEMAQGKKVKE